jgi:hypothetical protein
MTTSALMIGDELNHDRSQEVGELATQTRIVHILRIALHVTNLEGRSQVGV